MWSLVLKILPATSSDNATGWTYGSAKPKCTRRECSVGCQATSGLLAVSVCLNMEEKEFGCGWRICQVPPCAEPAIAMCCELEEDPV